MKMKGISLKKNILFCFCSLCIFYGNAQTDNRATAIQDSIQIHSLETVTVVATNNIRRNNTFQFSLKEVKPLISVIGETDVLRYIGTLPGVSQGMEGSLGFFIRGSNNGNNRIELDGVPLYGSDHVFGLFSTLSPDIVEKVHFRSGKLPASSGDFLASLTQISTICPDTVNYKGTFSLSPFMTGLSLNGPIIKNRLSFQVAGRISLLRPELQLIKTLTEMEGELIPEVADLYAKLYYQLNQQHTVDASGYYSNDYLKYSYTDESVDNIFEQNWKNNIFRLSWNWDISEFMQLNTLAYHNNFVSGQRQQNISGNGRHNSDLRLQTSLREWSAQSTLFYRKDNLNIAIGLQEKSQQIQPAAEKIFIGQEENTGNDHFSYNPKSVSQTFSCFGDFAYKYKNITSSVGYRGSYYQIKNHALLDNTFRFSLAMELSKEAGIEWSYDRLSQFHHVVEGLPVGWSLDLIIPSDSLFVPEKAQQYYAGGFWSNQTCLLSAGVYYKSMDNLTSYKNSSNIFGVQNTNWMDEVVSGKGESYGLELHAERKGENWNMALSYTLSKTNRHFQEINQGRVFPFKFDRRHILNLTGQMLTRKRKASEHHINFAFAFSSGHHLTLPIALYRGIAPPYWEQQSGIFIPVKEQENALYRQYMSSINGYSLPNYLRIDIGYTIHRSDKRFDNDWTIGIFNLLNRQNPYLIFYDEGRWKQLSIFPIVPSIKWTLILKKY